MLVPYEKPALNPEQQLQRLISRGLDVEDKESALVSLGSISYYRLSGCWYPYRQDKGKSNDLIAGTKFNDVLRLYEFDRHLRLLVMDAVERIEVHIRALIADRLGHVYGTFGHTESGNFHPQANHAGWLRKLREEASRSKDCFISHYKNKYINFPILPIWVTTEIMSLGSLSFCYKGMKHDDKRYISAQFGIHHKRLQDWLHKLTYIRNVCAHHARLWNRELAIRPGAVRDPEWNAPITPRKDRIFYILLILRTLLRATNNGVHWAERCNMLIDTSIHEKHFFYAMGIPENWKQHPIWK